MSGDRVEVVVVGAGFAGIAAALAARSAGHEVVMLERADRPGGTWRDNTYPGVACDVPAHLYGLAGHPDPGWSAEFAPGAEIQRYLESIVERSGLTDILRLGSPLLAAHWDDDERAWCIEVGGDRPVQLLAEVLVLACGRLTEPAIPLLPGLDGFAGAMFHSSRWDHSVPLEGAKVAVVGAGASAVQIVPALVAAGSQVVVFQRTPAWIVPRGGRAYSPDEQARFATHPEELEALRERLHGEGEARFASRSGFTDAAAEASAIALAHLAAQVADPALRAQLTPHYAFGCKRVLLSDDFYPALASGAAQLEPSALAGVDGGVLVSERGTRFGDIDAIVFATGFETARQPYAGLILGEDDEPLDQHWGEGMTSFGSVVVPGFPNLFVLNGPNASLGHTSSVLMLEHQAEYVARALAQRPAHGGVLRTLPEAELAYTRLIDDKAATTAWMTGGCRNWYVDERSGRLTLMWPGTAGEYGEFLATADGSEFAEAAEVAPLASPRAGRAT